MPRRAVVAKSTGVAVALLFCVRVAVSQEPGGTDGARHGATPADASASEQREAVNALRQEVQALQDELARLREQLTKVDHQLERLENMHGCGAPPAVAEDSPSCHPPVSLDPDGIKHYRKDCPDPRSDSAAGPCNPPYYLMEDGTKRVKVDCL
jgi:hypothetical protein